MQTPLSDVTRLLRKWNEGDRAALNQLMPVVYQELRKLADSYLREERPDHTLQPTALITAGQLRLPPPPSDHLRLVGKSVGQSAIHQSGRTRGRTTILRKSAGDCRRDRRRRPEGRQGATRSGDLLRRPWRAIYRVRPIAGRRELSSWIG